MSKSKVPAMAGGSSGNEVAIFGSSGVPALIQPLLAGRAAAANELAAAFESEAIGQAMTAETSLPIIRIDHAEREFRMADVPIGDAVEGYLLHYSQSRSYWKSKYKPGTVTPPDCASRDCITPLVMLDGDGKAKPPVSPSCISCPNAQFGSGDNGGQACKTTTTLLILSPDQFPAPGLAAMVLPPSSIASILGSPRKGGGYVNQAKAFRLPGGKPVGYYQIVWARFTLTPGDGPYCIVAGEPLALPPSEEEARAVAAYRGRMLAAFERLNGTVEAEAA